MFVLTVESSQKASSHEIPKLSEELKAKQQMLENLESGDKGLNKLWSNLTEINKKVHSPPVLPLNWKGAFQIKWIHYIFQGILALFISTKELLWPQYVKMSSIWLFKYPYTANSHPVVTCVDEIMIWNRAPFFCFLFYTLNCFMLTKGDII